MSEANNELTPQMPSDTISAAHRKCLELSPWEFDELAREWFRQVDEGGREWRTDIPALDADLVRSAWLALTPEQCALMCESVVADLDPCGYAEGVDWDTVHMVFNWCFADPLAVAECILRACEEAPHDED